jgi:predicted dehydrogenase
MKALKVLIIGLGSIGKKHIALVNSIEPGSIIFALRSKKEAEVYTGVTNIYSLDEIAITTVDFAIIANPTSEHKKTIEKLIKYEIPLFIEKPLHDTLDVSNLIDSITSKCIISYVACNLRFLESIKFIKDKIANCKLNEVNAYCGSYLPEWRPNNDFRKLYSANKELGGGVHIDLIHEIDYIYWLFGIPKEVKRNFRSQSSLSISAYDYANYLLDYEGFCANIVLNYYRRDPKRTIELIFEDETWSVDLLKNQIIVDQRIIFTSTLRITDTYLSQMKYFINCIDKKVNTFNTVSDAYNVLKICLDK